MSARTFPDLNRLAVLSIFLLTLSSCAPTATPTPFVPPTEAPQSIPVTQPASTPTITSTVITPTLTSTPPCTDGLTYIKDVTIPDGTTVNAGQSIDKQWLVTNSGTCNWDSSYRLKLINGDAMGAANNQALYPARAGAQVTLRITFTAPAASGTYRSAWQAFNPAGQAFGEPIYIQITVQ